MSTQITRKLEIDAGHRLMRHDGKCKNLHGHRYVFELTLEADALDEVGRVVDFGVVKAVVGKWLDDTFDHGFIVESGDPISSAIQADGTKLVVLDCAPSAENLARVVFENAVRLLSVHGEGLRVVRVRCHETPNCSADYAP